MDGKDEGSGEGNVEARSISSPILQHGLYYHEQQHGRDYMKRKVHHVIAKGVIPSCYLVKRISHIQEWPVVICTQNLISVELKTCKEARNILPLSQKSIFYNIRFIIILETIVK